MIKNTKYRNSTFTSVAGAAFLALVLGSSFSLRKPKVFVIGDSISMHYGPYLKKSLEGFFEYDRKRDKGQALEDLDKPVGANGGDSQRVRDYLDKLLQDPGFHTDYLLVNCGLHDIKTNPGTGDIQVSLQAYEENLDAIVKQAKKLRAQLVWITTTPVVDSIHNRSMSGFHRYAKNLGAYNQAALGIMNRNKVPVIDLHTYTVKFGPGVFKDHVHFDHKTREKQADFIAGALAEIHRLRGDQ